MEVIKFGGTKEEQTYLADLVLRGEKNATSSLKILQNFTDRKATKIGDIWQIRNGLNEDICVVEVIEVDVILFGDIDEVFAIQEGDGTFDNWYDIHFNYYSKQLLIYELLLTNETELECVWFKRINNKRYKKRRIIKVKKLKTLQNRMIILCLLK